MSADDRLDQLKQLVMDRTLDRMRGRRALTLKVMYGALGIVLGLALLVLSSFVLGPLAVLSYRLARWLMGGGF